MLRIVALTLTWNSGWHKLGKASGRVSPMKTGDIGRTTWVQVKRRMVIWGSFEVWKYSGSGGYTWELITGLWNHQSQLLILQLRLGSNKFVLRPFPSCYGFSCKSVPYPLPFSGHFFRELSLTTLFKVRAPSSFVALFYLPVSNHLTYYICHLLVCLLVSSTRERIFLSFESLLHPTPQSNADT